MATATGRSRELDIAISEVIKAGQKKTYGKLTITFEAGIPKAIKTEKTELIKNL